MDINTLDCYHSDKACQIEDKHMWIFIHSTATIILCKFKGGSGKVTHCFLFFKCTKEKRR